MFFFKSSLSVDEIDRVHYLENKCKNLEEKIEKLITKKVRQKETDETRRILKINTRIR